MNLFKKILNSDNENYLALRLSQLLNDTKSRMYVN